MIFLNNNIIFLFMQFRMQFPVFSKSYKFLIIMLNKHNKIVS